MHHFYRVKEVRLDYVIFQHHYYHKLFYFLFSQIISKAVVHLVAVRVAPWNPVSTSAPLIRLGSLEHVSTVVQRDVLQRNSSFFLFAVRGNYVPDIIQTSKTKSAEFNLLKLSICTFSHFVICEYSNPQIQRQQISRAFIFVTIFRK